MIKSCKVCKGKFKSKPSKNRKYCSRECFYSVQHKDSVREIRECLVCEEKFSTTALKNKKYCSKPCQSIGQHLSIHKYDKDNRLISKKCSVCSDWKSPEEFHKDTKILSGYRSNCKECCFHAHLMRKYGLTPEQYYLMSKVCEICGGSVKLCVDHCHDTGNIRGILCDSCNTALGRFNDSVENLKRAIEYLEKQPCPTP